MAKNLKVLQTRAGAGDPRAMASLGRMLMFGDGVAPAPMMGGVYLRDALHKGDGEAAAVLAYMAAWGYGQPRDLGAALTLLKAAAERGWTPAQAQLRILARGEGSDWDALLARVDVQKLRTPPPQTPLSTQPRIRAIEHFATPEECDWLIERARGQLQRATIYQGSAEQKASNLRTNTECSLTMKSLDLVSCFILDRLSAAARVTPAFCEFAKVLHYKPGQHFGRHADFYDVVTPELRQEIALRGQRVATFLIYLNEGYEGGETEFTEVGVSYKGAKGDALFFINVLPDGAPDYATAHQGAAPTRGEKWLFSQWIRSKAMNIHYTPGQDQLALSPSWLTDV